MRLNRQKQSMKRNIKKLSWAYLALLVMLFCFTPAIPVNAQTQTKRFDVSVSPILFDFSAKPGDTIKNKIRLRNNNTQDLPVSIKINHLTPDGKNGEGIFKDINSTDDFPTWVHLEQTNATARGQEWLDIPFTINIPAEARFGYYYAFVIEPNTENTTLTKTPNTTLSGGVAIPILLKIESDDAQAAANMLSFQTSKKLYEYPPVDFQTEIQNTGNVHVKPRGNIFISTKNKKDIAVLEINPEKGAILPNSQRIFSASWAEGFVTREPIIQDGETKLDQNGQPKTKITFHWDKITSLRFGHYTAKIVMAFDDGSQDVVLEKETDFWVIPYTFIIVVLLLIIARFIILNRWRHARTKRLLQKQREVWEQQNGNSKKRSKKTTLKKK